MKGDVYNKFFDLVRSVYTLDAPAEYHYTTPLFDSWSIEEADTPSNIEIVPVNTDAESDARSQSSNKAPVARAVAIASPIVLSSGSDIPPNRPAASSRMPGAVSTQELARMFSSTSISSEDENEKPLSMPLLQLKSASQLQVPWLNLWPQHLKVQDQRLEAEAAQQSRQSRSRPRSPLQVQHLKKR